jgi:hypothetical protein
MVICGALGRCGIGFGTRAILQLHTVNNLRRIARCTNWIGLWSYQAIPAKELLPLQRSVPDWHFSAFILSLPDWHSSGSILTQAL